MFYLCAMQSEFEKNREMIYKLLRVLNGVMVVSNNNVITEWVFDEKTQKIKKIK
jgi:hypothetical protein